MHNMILDYIMFKNEVLVYLYRLRHGVSTHGVVGDFSVIRLFEMLGFT